MTYQAPAPAAVDPVRELMEQVQRVYQICHETLTKLDSDVYNSAYRKGAYSVAHQIGDVFGWH